MTKRKFSFDCDEFDILGDHHCDKQNYKQAINYYQLSVDYAEDDTSRANALFNLANCHHNNGDYKNAMQYYQLSGNLDALYKLGIYYRYGKGVKKDPEIAMKYFLRVKNADALYQLGKYYHKTKDYIQALKYYKLSADKGRAGYRGHSKSLFRMGMYYLNGVVIMNGINEPMQILDTDFEKAFEYFTLSWNKGNYNALFHLGVAYYKGQGVPQNRKKARKCFKTCVNARKCYARSLCNLAICCDDGHTTHSPFCNCAFTFGYFKSASEQNCPEATHGLGVYYYEGRGVERDYKKAFECFQANYIDGFADSKNNLGMCYLYGRGVAKDLIKAHELLTNANLIDVCERELILQPLLCENYVYMYPLYVKYGHKNRHILARLLYLEYFINMNKMPEALRLIAISYLL